MARDPKNDSGTTSDLSWVGKETDEGHKLYRNKNSNIFGGKGEMTQNKNEEMELIDRDATLPNPRK